MYFPDYDRQGYYRKLAEGKVKTHETSAKNHKSHITH